MPHSHIFPPADADFNGYVDTSISYLVNNGTRLSISTDNVTLVQGLQSKWDKKLLQHD
jgi:hypothetical protein